MQYVSIRYTERLAQARIEPPVGSVGDSYDNALAETATVIHRPSCCLRRLPGGSEGRRVHSINPG